MAGTAQSTPPVGSELQNVVNGPTPALDVTEAEVAETPDVTEVPDYVPDDWAKQQINLSDEPSSKIGLGVPKEAAGTPKAPPPGYVPQQALSEARAEAKAMGEKIERMNQRFEDTIRLLQGQRPPAEQPKPPSLPDAEQDPVGHMKARFDRLEQAMNGMIGMQQQGVGQMQTVQAINADEMAFKAQHQDYDQALNFVRARRAQELTEVMGMTAQQAAQTMAQEELLIASNAMRRNESPAAVAYKLAQRWGYKNGAGKVDQSDQAQAAAAEATKKIEAAKQGMEAAKSLGTVAGQTPAGDAQSMTLEALADLPAEQFLKAFDKVMGASKAAKSQLPGFLQR